MGTSLEVQLLRLHRPMQGTQGRSLVKELRSHTHMPWGQKSENVKQKQYCNKLNKDFKNGPHRKKYWGTKKEIAAPACPGLCLRSVSVLRSCRK